MVTLNFILHRVVQAMEGKRSTQSEAWQSVPDWNGSGLSLKYFAMFPTPYGI